MTVCAVLRELGVRSLTVISREGEDNYENLSRHRDAELIVNTTPVGMYPNNGASPLDLSAFPLCAGVLDVVYNPARTALLLQAEELGIAHAGGLYMLVAQAKRAAELFTGRTIDDAVIDKIASGLSARMGNIVIVGMPGSGKSSISRLLGERLGRPVYEADELIAAEAGMSIPEIFSSQGEARFRELETLVLGRLGKLSGAVISTGGGCVTREENYPLLHQNGRIVWLQRDIDKLPKEGRPISQKNDLAQLYSLRRPMYQRFSDLTADNNGSFQETLEGILEVLK